MAGKVSTRKPTSMAAGRRYGRLTAVKLVRPFQIIQEQWLFKCDCGKEHVATSANVKAGRTLSCGCLHVLLMTGRKPGNTRHGLSKTRTYTIWGAMRQRCENPKSTWFSRYGGRGIKVCKRWRNFENFYADMGPAPDGMTLERKKNDRGYSKANCCWSDQKTQCRNRRTNLLVQFMGRRMSLAEACERAGLRYGMVQLRLYNGWPAKRALSTPSRQRPKL
jgi:hypothetical protein